MSSNNICKNLISINKSSLLTLLPTILLFGLTFLFASALDAQVVTLSTTNGDFPVGLSTDFVVPDGVCSIDVTAVGAAGGDGLPRNSGGKGATVMATNIPVSAGDILKVMVGAQGVGDNSYAGGGGGSGVVSTSNGFTALIIAGGGGGRSDGNGGDAITINTTPVGNADGGAGVGGGAGGGAFTAGTGGNMIGVGGIAPTGPPFDGSGGNGLGAGGGGSAQENGAGGGGGATGGAEGGGGDRPGDGGTSFLQGATIGVLIPGATATNTGDGSVTLSYNVDFTKCPAVPTLGQWGLIVLSILMACLGIVAIRELVQNLCLKNHNQKSVI